MGQLAVEETTLQIKKYGDTLTPISMGPEGVNETLRRVLAMGEDQAIREALGT